MTKFMVAKIDSSTLNTAKYIKVVGYKNSNIVNAKVPKNS